ncbi:uncharacterized protein LOC103714574 isoform X4 [Phoenix dactylifera]|uniref:Uncharacterized protein LOC103714574 isoform X4 n=1 Tax=Phoenix dactylifera TaxID=42345 RepID=A0A8B7CIY5_PHODC|nr:uncharacterized protein LOC103714574 isoform X4 [Phoenix dactylifera]
MPALPLMVEVLARVQQMPPLSRQERGLHFLRLTERLGSCSSSLRPHLRVNGARTTTPEQRSLIGVTSCRSKLPMNDSWINILALSHWKQWQPVIACNSRGPVETIKHGVTEFSAIPPGILAGYVQACHCS